MPEDLIDVTGLDPAAVLAALYDYAEPLGMGVLHHTPEPMTPETAAALIDGVKRGSSAYFDYIGGRPLKVRIPLNDGRRIIDAYAYDRNQGNGAAARAIDGLRVAS